MTMKITPLCCTITGDCIGIRHYSPESKMKGIINVSDITNQIEVQNTSITGTTDDGAFFEMHKGRFWNTIKRKAQR
jgi:hypothetical protein